MARVVAAMAARWQSAILADRSDNCPQNGQQRILPDLRRSYQTLLPLTGRRPPPGRSGRHPARFRRAAAREATIILPFPSPTPHVTDTPAVLEHRPARTA